MTQPDRQRPVAGHAALVTGFLVATVGALTSARRAATGGAAPPTRMSDVILLGVATHTVSRTLARDRVTSFVRAPFAERQAAVGHGEVDDRPIGTGLRHAIGELLTCPLCLDQWVATAFVSGFVARPKLTRTVASLFVVRTVADAAQLAHAAAIASADRL